MTNALHLMEFDNFDSDVTIQFWEKFTHLSESDTQFRQFILCIPENSDVIFMNMDLDKARDICRVIEAKIAAESAMACID